MGDARSSKPRCLAESRDAAETITHKQKSTPYCSAHNRFATPCIKQKTPKEYKHQNPASGRPAGANGKQDGESKTEKQPTWRDVSEADLRDTDRLLELHHQGVAAGFVDRGENVRLQFVAAAEHARAVTTSNPAGLFVRLVRGKLWHFATQADEDQARGRLRAFVTIPADDGPPKRKAQGAEPERTGISWNNLLDFLGFEFPAPGRAVAP